jgi:hypothetical protein
LIVVKAGLLLIIVWSINVLAARPLEGGARTVSVSPTTTPDVTPQLIVTAVDMRGDTLPGVFVKVSYESAHGPRVISCSAGVRGIVAIAGLPVDAADVVVRLPGFRDQLFKDVRLGRTAGGSLVARMENVANDHDLEVNDDGHLTLTPAVTPTATPVPTDMANVRCAAL